VLLEGVTLALLLAGETATWSWQQDATPPTDEWRWELVSVERTGDRMEGVTASPAVSLKAPRTGLWWFRVRACNARGCSPWTGTEGRILMYQYVAPPAGVAFE